MVHDGCKWWTMIQNDQKSPNISKNYCFEVLDAFLWTVFAWKWRPTVEGINWDTSAGGYRPPHPPGPGPGPLHFSIRFEKFDTSSEFWIFKILQLRAEMWRERVVLRLNSVRQISRDEKRPHQKRQNAHFDHALRQTRAEVKFRFNLQK